MRVLLLVLMLSTLHSAWGQTPGGSSSLTKEHFLKKAKTQKTWSEILGVTGGGLLIAGSIMSLADLGDGFTDRAGANERTARLGETLAYVGGGLFLVSLPLQFAYKRNQKVAASLAVGNRRFLLPQQGAPAAAFRPFLSLRVQLDRP